MFTSTYPIRILLIDDHPIVQSGLGYELSKNSGLHLVGVAGTVADSLTLLRHSPVDVVVSDLYLGDSLTGVHLLLKLREMGLELPVLIMSSDEKPATVRQVLTAGAAGYLGKSSSPGEFVEAIQSLFQPGRSGTRYVAPPQLRQRLDQLAPQPASYVPERAQLLTRKELSTLRAFGQGLEPKEIAHKHKVATTTVYSHLNHVREKLGIRHEVELRNFAIKYLLRDDA